MEDNNNAKNVDGIKKLSRDKIAKSRKMVLDIIGEGAEKTAEKSVPESTAARKVDGIAAKLFAPKEKIPEIKKTITLEQKASWQKEMGNILPDTAPLPKPEARIAEKYTTPDKPLDNRHDYIAPDFTKDVIQESYSKFSPLPGAKAPGKISKGFKDFKAVVGGKIGSSKLNQLNPAAQENKKTEETKKIIDEKKRAKREIEAKRKLAEDLEHNVKTEARRKKRADLIAGWQRTLKELPIKLGMALRTSVYVFSLVLIMLFLLYSVLAVAELKFDLDNKILRAVSRYFPVPAILTKYGIIEYYKYKDILVANGNTSANNAPVDAIKNTIAQHVIYLNLLERYNLLDQVSDLALDENMFDHISSLIVKDNGINQVGLERIKKIKQLIDENGDFVQVASKYGDELGQVTITEENKNDYPYYSQIASLVKDEVSGIVFTNDGYYLFRCYEKSEGRIALSYALIRAKTLDQYIDDSSKNLRMWSLVK